MMDEERRALSVRLAAERERLNRLPRTSAYVLHRQKCVTRALGLLGQQSNSSVVCVDGDELASLLDALSLAK
jgi:hypothetical protein